MNEQLFYHRDVFCKDCPEPRCDKCHVLDFVKYVSKQGVKS